MCYGTSVFQVDSLVKYLWDAMLDLDDLTSSTHSMMTLLSALLTVDRLQQFKFVPMITFVCCCLLLTRKP